MLLFTIFYSFTTASRGLQNFDGLEEIVHRPSENSDRPLELSSSSPNMLLFEKPFYPKREAVEVSAVAPGKKKVHEPISPVFPTRGSRISFSKCSVHARGCIGVAARRI